MNSTILSVCIPSHNRLNMLLDWVSNLIKIDDNRFDVVISDTSSGEGQKALLQKLKNLSTRIKVIENPPDTLPTQNWLIALTSGIGNFVMHVNDRDAIRLDNFCGFLDFLESNLNCLGGICCDYGHSIVNDSPFPSKLFTRDPLFCYKRYHPTGLLFNYNELKKENDLDEIFDRNVEDYPHSLLLGRFSMRGKIFVYSPQVWTRPSREWYMNNQSGIVMLDKQFFLAPHRCLLQARRYITEIDSFDIPEALKKQWRSEIIKRGAFDCTVYYFHALSDYVTSLHWLGTSSSLSFTEKHRMINDVLEQFRNEFHCNIFKLKIMIYARLMRDHIVKHIPNFLKSMIKKCMFLIIGKKKVKEL